MRLNVSFGVMVTDLRAELERSSELAHGVQDLAHLKRALNAEYQNLYTEWDWNHLRRDFTPIETSAGQRFYDPPDNLNFERIEKVRCWWNGTPHPVERGIGISEYSSYDSEEDERSDPVLKWDIRYHDTPTDATMLELWPIPASAGQQIEFTGTFSISNMVDDADVCLLDADTIVAAAAARLTTGDERNKHLGNAMRRFDRIKGRQPDSRRTRIGLGPTNRGPLAGKAIVRVS